MNDEARSDEDLIVGIAQGESAAMTEFYNRWFKQFAKLATKLTRDFHAGEDIAQEAVIRVIENAKNYIPGRSPKSWLTTIVYHLAHDLGRRRVVRQAVSLSGSVDDDSGPRAAEIADRAPTGSELAEAHEREAAVLSAILQLNDDERQVIVLKDYDGLNATQAGELLGILPGTFSGRLHRARLKFKAILQTDWPGLFPAHEL